MTAAHSEQTCFWECCFQRCSSWWPLGVFVVPGCTLSLAVTPLVATCSLFVAPGCTPWLHP